MSGPRTLVTGTAGLVGGAVVRRLVEEGVAVVATDMREAALPKGIDVVAADLGDRAAVEQLLKGQRVERIIHCGAVSGPMVAAGDPHRVFHANVQGTLNLLEAARSSGARRVVALSSAGVYGRQATLAPVAEDATLNATDTYGCSKIAAEAVLKAYGTEHGLAVTVLRPSSIFGPGRTTACFIRDLIEAAAGGTPIAIDRSARCRRQFVHIDDVVAAVVAAAALPATEHLAHNVAGGTWLTEVEVVQLAASALPGLTLADESAPPRCLDGIMGPLDCARAADAFGYQPRVDLATGIAAFAQSLRDAPPPR